MHCKETKQNGAFNHSYISCYSCTADKYINQNDLILGMSSSVLYNHVKCAVLFPSR